MQAFADLLERLMLTPCPDGKRAHLMAYFRAVPSPDRGFALAVLTGDLEAPRIKPAIIREMIEARMDAELFRLSLKNGGDLAETVALVWPEGVRANRAVPVVEFAQILTEAAPEDRAVHLANWLGGLDATGRWAALKLAMGGVNVGVTPHLARAALADFGGVDVGEVEEIWHGLTPPYVELFAWLDGEQARPQPQHAAPFRAMAEVTAFADPSILSYETHATQWGVSGVRVLLVCERGLQRLYSSAGDEISHLFPDVLEESAFDGAVDGVLFVRADIPSDGLNKRLKQKRASKAQLTKFPAYVCAYDLLNWNGDDMRALPFAERHAALKVIVSDLGTTRVELPPALTFTSVSDLADARNAPPLPGIDGVMVKRWDAAYDASEAWAIWRREPHTILAVLMYVERGTGARSNAYASGTLGVWGTVDGEDVLLPVAKTLFDLDADTIKRIDEFARANTVERFGPVRSITATNDAGLVFEIAFDGLDRAERRKSGLKLRGIQVKRLLADTLPAQSGRIETLEALLPDG